MIDALAQIEGAFVAWLIAFIDVDAIPTHIMHAVAVWAHDALERTVDVVANAYVVGLVSYISARVFLRLTFVHV